MRARRAYTGCFARTSLNMTSSPSIAAPVGLLLAAGRGTRFAAADDRHDASRIHADKLLARLPDGRAIAVAAAQNLRAALPRVIAVLRPGADTLAERLQEAGCEILFSEDSARGMGASLASGARHLLETSPADARPTCVVALADMPWIASSTIQDLLAASAGQRITAPDHGGQRGHPVVFCPALLPELARLDGDTGARDLLTREPLTRWPCVDAGVVNDVDLPQDLRRPVR